VKFKLYGQEFLDIVKAARAGADEVTVWPIAILHPNSRCVSKPAILLDCADPGVPEKSKSSPIFKGLRFTRRACRLPE